MPRHRGLVLSAAALALAGATALPAVDAMGQRRAAARAVAPLDPAPLVDSIIRDSWTNASRDFESRLRQDTIQRLCSRYADKPPKRVANAIRRMARATIEYPPGGVLSGDPARGEALAQSGYGLRFTDKDARRANGGNCYACHKIGSAEESYGTLGPDLTAYVRANGTTEAAARKVYDKIYNPHAETPCSAMPRFGANGVLTTEQIRDLVALVVSRASAADK